AISHIRQPHAEPLYFWCLLILAVDIFILVTAGRNILSQMPRVNLFFRIVEIIFFLCIGIMMLMQQHWVIGTVHCGLFVGYCYLFYCEKNLPNAQLLGFHHTGVSMPGVPDQHFMLWSNINEVHARYDSVHIETSSRQRYEFTLRKNLDFEELEQIHE